MGKIENTLAAVLREASDANISFNDLCLVLKSLDFCETFMSPRYEIIIYWSAEDGAYLAEVPELPGAMADGASYQEALRNAELIVQEWIATAQELGRPIPEPRGRLMYA